ncbi:MAG: hypothetical protein GY700_06560 [Propionibacteriaceae bacterium]|nr:hypothetical protein [Propionibacteriaceae bacterium]
MSETINRMTGFARARADGWGEYFEVYIGEERERAFWAVKATELEQIPVGESPEPTVRITRQQAQRLLDNLWDAGLRPKDGTGSTGQLAATEKHLEDMRSLAFNSLKANEVKP